MPWLPRFAGNGSAPLDSFGMLSFDERETREVFLQMGVQPHTLYAHKDGPPMEPGNSTKGIEHRGTAQRLKEEGNEALKRGDLSPALQLYLEGLKAAYVVSDNHEQVSILASNASHVYYLMKDFLNARKYGIYAYQARPGWYKGLWRFFLACRGLGLNVEALLIVPELMIRASNQVAHSECVKLFIECLLTASKETGMPETGYFILKEKVLPLLTISGALWSDALTRLSEKGEWKIIKVSLFGDEGLGPLLMSFDASNIKLRGLLDHCTPPNWKLWGEKLAMRLLENKASFKNLASSEKSPLHRALDVGIGTGTFELLKVLLMTHVPSADRDCTDEEGNTLLHVVCRNRFSERKQVTDLLIKYKLDPNIRNQTGHTPADFLTENDPDHRILLDILVRAGYQPLPPRTKEDMEQFPGPGGDVIKLSTRQPRAATVASLECKDQSVNTWTKARVQQWLRDKGLEACATKFNEINGPLLAELKVVQGTAPEYFNQALLDLQLTLRDLLQFSSVLREL